MSGKEHEDNRTSDRRAFLKRLAVASAAAPPVFVMLGATPAERRQSPYDKTVTALRNSRELARRAQRVETVEQKKRMLTELMEMERAAMELSKRLPKMEMERLAPEFRRLKSDITALRRATNG